jgi:hypothetical protein
MVEEEKPIKMDAATIWCDKTLLKELKAAIKQSGGIVADELNELFRRRLAEFRGVGVDPNSSNEEAGRRYEKLKARHTMLVDQVDRLQKQLRKFNGGEDTYDEACELLNSVGIKADYSNADEVIPKFIQSWKGSREFIHEYISLAELVRDKKQVEARLDEVRAPCNASLT